MTEILKTMLSLSLSGSLLILLLFLLRPVIKARLSKRWQYYIWLVVAARLMLPFAPEENFMGTFFQGIDRAVTQTELAAPTGQPTAVAGISSAEYKTDGSKKLHHEQRKPMKSAGILARIVSSAMWKHLWPGWFAIALILLIRKITIYQDFVKYIRAGSEEAGDIDLLERFGKLVEKSRVTNTVELCTKSLISSPLLIGFFHPCIVLPTADLSSSDFEYTILHELTHYKRRDMFYKWLIQLIVCVHWFNPLVYLMRREIDRACELSCDEAVIKTLDPGGRKAYGDTLLHAMGAGGRYRDSLASVTLNESRELLKERLDAIMRFKRTTRLTAAVSAALVLALSFTAAVTGAYAASPDAENTVVINLSNEGQHSVLHSSSFEAKDGQILTLKITSSIKGAADLFLFSPSNQEQRIPIGGNSETKTIPLSEGRWSYNCTGFFDSGNISIVGTLSSSQSAAAEALGDAPSGLTVTDPDPNDMIVIDLSDEGQKCIVHSSGFEAKDGQILTLEITSSINGSVDLFLFSPSNQEQRITMGGSSETKTIPLSEGRWSYNCTGFFDSGSISIVGTLQ